MVTKATYRYYAQHLSCGDDLAFFSHGWYIFDRECVSLSGECIPVGKAVSRHFAFKIRDALNAPEKSLREEKQKLRKDHENANANVTTVLR